MNANFPHITFDAANPPTAAPSDAVGVMGYLGGPRADRVWPLEEWLPFSHLKQFGIYVPDITLNPHTQGSEAVQLALALGWSSKMTGAQQRAIIIDLETRADAAWYQEIAETISSRGFMPIVYGSLSTVLDNAAADVLAADWDGQAIIPPGQTLRGGQYSAEVPFRNTLIDYSIIDEWLYLRGGVGPRRRVA